MPDRLDWYGKGTTMRPSSARPYCQPSERPLFASSKANSHSPFRFNHSARTNCGRGYSGRDVSIVFTKPPCFSIVEGGGGRITNGRRLLNRRPSTAREMTTCVHERTDALTPPRYKSAAKRKQQRTGF